MYGARLRCLFYRSRITPAGNLYIKARKKEKVSDAHVAGNLSGKHRIYLSVLGLRSVKIRTDTHVAGEANAGHEVSDENIGLLHDVHVEKVGERLDVEDGDDVGINAEEERESGGNVRPENGALVLLNSALEEGFGALEPEIVQPV